VLCRRRVVSCCSGSVCSFVLVNLGTERRDIGATEESECDSSSIAGGRGETGMFCAGESRSVSQLTGFPAAG
jgi:hypothetical protein